MSTVAASKGGSQADRQHQVQMRRAIGSASDRRRRRAAAAAAVSVTRLAEGRTGDAERANKAFEQTPRELGAMSIRDGRSSTPGR